MSRTLASTSTTASPASKAPRFGLRRSLAHWGALFFVATLTPVLPRAVAQQAANPADEEFVEIGRLDRIGEDTLAIFGDKIVPTGFYDPVGSKGRNDAPYAGTVGTLLPLHEARQLWQLITYHNGTALVTAVVVRDMDSLRIRTTFVLPYLLARVAFGTGGQWMSAVDGDRTVFLVANGPKAILSIDLRTFERRVYQAPPHLSIPPIGGLEYDRFGQRVIGLGAPIGGLYVGNATSFVVAVDLATGDWGVRVLRSCTGPLPPVEQGRTTQFAPYITERYVYAPCHRAGFSGIVVRLERNDLLNPAGTEAVAVGPTNLDSALTDRRAGRMVLATTQGVIWVFDAASMAFVGVVGAHAGPTHSAHLGYGLDEESGRLFFQSPTYGLGGVDLRYFPVPQAKMRPDLAAPSQETLVSDMRTNRLFVLREQAQSKEHFYRIYRVKPAPPPPPPPDPDRNTSDQPEVAGVTESRYNASASGYGTRVLLANGISTVPPAPAVGDQAPTADVLMKHLNAKCGFTDRELVAARVARSEADTGSTVAEAAAVTVDPRTRLDLDRPSRCEPYGKDTSTDRLEPIFATAPEPYDNADERNPRWNRDPALCSTSEGDDPKQAHGDDHGATPLGTAGAECPTPGKGDVAASARTALVGAISVGKAESKTVITRGAGRVRARAEAVAADVSIGEGIRIGEIRSVAVSESDGRPKSKPMSTHTVVIRDVTIAGTEVCGVCDPSTVLDEFNRVASGRAEFRFGAAAADARLVRGSPKGALTAVQKSVERQVSDRSLVGDFTVDIPALELVVYNDNGKWGRGRQLYQFAGVATSATYNIVPLPTSSGLGDEDGDEEGAPTDEGSGEGAGSAIGGGPADASADDVGAEPVALDGVSALAQGDASDGGLLAKVGRALVAVGRGLRLFLTDPRHGLAILTGWALLGLPAVLVRRRLAVAGDR